MEVTARKSSATWQRRATAAAFVALALTCRPGPALAADTYWELHSDNVTVIAAGDKAIPEKTGSLIVRMRQTARWVAGWPESYQPPAVMAFVLPNSTIDEYFGQYRTAPDEPLLGRAKQGIVVSLPQTTVLIFALGPDRGRELEPLQFLYGQKLLDTGPRSHWPECVRYGLSVILASSGYLPGDEVYFRTSDVTFPMLAGAPALGPADVMRRAEDEKLRYETRNRLAYSCFVLAMMALHEELLPRANYERYFDAIANGAPFEDAAQSAFAMSDAAFTKKIAAFGYRVQSRPRSYNLRVVITTPMPDWPATEPLAPERANRVLLTLRERLFGPPLQ
jgi:hypothetical protein